MWARDRSFCELFGGQGGNRTPTAEGGWSTASGAHHLLNLPTVAAASGRELRSRDGTRHRNIRSGADDGTRTRNLLFTKQLLYQLSYVGATRRDIPQLTPLAPGNDRAVRLDGSSAGGAGRPRLPGFRGRFHLWTTRQEMVLRGQDVRLRRLRGGLLCARRTGTRRLGRLGRGMWFGGFGRCRGGFRGPCVARGGGV